MHFLADEAAFTTFRNRGDFNPVRNTENDGANIVVGNEPVTRSVTLSEP
jgi:hypothetical protein